MPELSRFAGIIIYMYFRDNERHNKPHIHAEYAEHKAEVALDGELLAGELPVRQMKMLTGWLAFHEEELYAAWNKAVQGLQFGKIEPMK